jgi:hypothetical protein
MVKDEYFNKESIFMDELWDALLFFPPCSTAFFFSLLGLLFKFYYVTKRFRKKIQSVYKIDDLTWVLAMSFSLSGPIEKRR